MGRRVEYEFADRIGRQSQIAEPRTVCLEFKSIPSKGVDVHDGAIAKSKAGRCLLLVRGSAKIDIERFLHRKLELAQFAVDLELSVLHQLGDGRNDVAVG